MRLQHRGAFTLAVLLAPAAAMAGVVSTIEFTAAEGYVNGQLVGQDAWTGPTQWSVNTGGGGSAVLTSDGFRTLTRPGPSGASLNLSVGESATFRTVIQMAGTLVTPATDQQIMNIGIGTTATAGSYVRLYLTTDGNITLFNSNANQPSGDGVGFSITANGNDRLAIDTTYTVGVGNFGSTTTHQLTNLDSGLSTGTGTRLWGQATPDLYNLVTGTGDVGSYRQTTWSIADTGITGITMLSTDVVAVPEPAVLPLAVAAAGLAGIAWRRRRLSMFASR
jgi:hypothetical protein